MVSTETTSARLLQAWAILEQVPDPEIPAISICDLGIVRELLEIDDILEIVVTPTYSGCPATDQISRDIYTALSAAQLGPLRLRWQRAPAWTTDWISAEGKSKLRAYGIAPPAALNEHPIHFAPYSKKNSATIASNLTHNNQQESASATICCPRCASTKTEEISRFGATACKALYRCRSCLEPFEYFKPI